MTNRTRETGDVGYRAYKKNYLINGEFDIWARGTPFIGGINGYNADRWAAQVGVSQAEKVTVETGSNSRSGAKITTTSNAAYVQAIELINQGKGGRFVPPNKFTLSGWVNSSDGVNLTGTIAFRDTALSGTNQVVEANFSNRPLATTDGTWQYFEETYECSILPNPTNNAYVVLLNLVGAGTIFLTGLQLEEGTSATEFEYVSPQEQLTACQRYYEKIGAGESSYITGFAISTTSGYAGMDFSVLKRGKPDITVSLPTEYSLWGPSGALLPTTGLTVLENTTLGMFLLPTCTGVAVGDPLLLSLKNDGYIEVDAEL